MKKVLIGILIVIVAVVGIGVFKGEAIMDALFYDMDATMDLPENLYEDQSLVSAKQLKGESKAEIYVADVNDYLSLREEPSSRAKVLEKLPPNTQMEVLSRDNAPYVQVYVTDLKIEGYVHEDYIKIKE